MKIGIIGHSQSGVSAIFEGLCGKGAQDKSGRRLGVSQVHDSRIDFLSAHFNPKKTTFIHLDFVEFGDPSKAIAEAKKGFGEFIAALREVDALLIVLRAFETDFQLTPPNPEKELEQILSDLSLADLDVAMKRVEKLEKSVTKPTKTQEQEKKELPVIRLIQETIEKGEDILKLKFNETDEKIMSCFGFLTTKPLIVMANIGESETPAKWLAAHPKIGAYDPCVFPATLALELAQLKPEERKEFIADLGLDSSPIEALLQRCLKKLGLNAFFTVGEDEVRAWPVPQTANAVTAAGVIHSDLARGFIRAEVISYEDFKTCGDMKKVKEANKVRLEGKEYAVRDGDILNIRFCV